MVDNGTAQKIFSMYSFPEHGYLMVDVSDIQDVGMDPTSYLVYEMPKYGDHEPRQVCFLEEDDELSLFEKLYAAKYGVGAFQAVNIGQLISFEDFLIRYSIKTVDRKD